CTRSRARARGCERKSGAAGSLLDREPGRESPAGPDRADDSRALRQRPHILGAYLNELRTVGSVGEQPCGMAARTPAAARTGGGPRALLQESSAACRQLRASRTDCGWPGPASPPSFAEPGAPNCQEPRHPEDSGCAHFDPTLERGISRGHTADELRRDEPG